MAEVAKQRSEFKPYDFSAIVQAITADETLKATRNASKETEEAFAKFKEYFKPGVIKLGKSFIKEHLQEGYKVYDQNWGPWNGNQLLWFLRNIIGTMQCRAEKCFEQACSQGLKEIVEEIKPLKRSVKLKNHINDAELTFRGSPDGKLFLLGRDFFVEIYYGCRGEYARRDPQLIEELCRATRSGMEKFKQQLQDLVHEVVLGQYSPSC